MSRARSRAPIGTIIIFVVLTLIGGYFAFAAVRGDNGVIRRMEIRAEAETLRETRDTLRAELAALENRTRRLSDDYLDLDLLGERARAVLGYVRQDELVIR